MKVGHYLPRLTKRDIEDLTVASLKCAEVATAIQATKSPWSATAVQQLRDVNDIVLRLRDRAATRMTKVLERIGDQLDAEARAKASDGGAGGRED
jgi:hypothetical protein